MTSNIFIHPANPIPFRPLGYSTTDRYNTVPAELQWYAENILPWQQPDKYAVKIQSKDKLSLQVWANGDSISDVAITLDLIRCDQSVVKSGSFSLITSPTNISFNNGIYNGFSFQGFDFWTSIDEGQYWIKLTFVSTSGADTRTDYRISEPLSVKANHPDTVLWQYSNNANIGGLIFEQTRQFFEKRIAGALVVDKDILEGTVFVDSGYNSTELSVFPFKEYTIAIGGNGHLLPSYEHTIMNHVIACSSKKMDRRSFVRPDGAAWDRNIIDTRLTKYSATIQLRDVNNDSIYGLVTGDILISGYSGFPAVQLYVRLGSDGIYDFAYSVPYYIADSSGLTSYAALLNSVIEFAEGTFYATTDGLYYTLAPFETYNQSDSRYLSSFMQITEVTDASGETLDTLIELIGNPAGSSQYALVAPDLTVEFSGSCTFSTPAVLGSNFESTAAATYIHRLFHDNSTYAIDIAGPYITAIAGTSPNQMAEFVLHDSPKITSFAMYSSLSNSEFNLQSLLIKNNTLLSSLNGYYVPGSPNHSLGKVFLMDFRGNKMNTSQIDLLYNNIYGSIISGLFTVHNGSINTSGQTTGNTASSASSTARLLLQITYGWSVTI